MSTKCLEDCRDFKVIRSAVYDGGGDPMGSPHWNRFAYAHPEAQWHCDGPPVVNEYDADLRFQGLRQILGMKTTKHVVEYGPCCNELVTETAKIVTGAGS